MDSMLKSSLLPSFLRPKTLSQPSLIFFSLPSLPTAFEKITTQFAQSGCENCQFLQMDGERGRVDVCTTVEFSGVVSVLKPTASWCAKWLRVENGVPGCYAISVRPPVEGLPEDVADELERRGIDWRGEGQ